jgi:hypothetical protein
MKYQMAMLLVLLVDVMLAMVAMAMVVWCV